MWRSNLDFIDLDYLDFSRFETVYTVSELSHGIDTVVGFYSLPPTFTSILSTNLYNYCFGKLIALRDVKMWKHNFLGEINMFLMEHMRYLQSLYRDVNTNIDKKGTDKQVEVNKGKQGNVSSGQVGSTTDSQNSAVQGSDTQGSTNALGDTLTILNNQTTSTNYLASKNDESFSRGEVSHATSSDFNKTHGNSTSLSQSNNQELSFGIAENVKDTSGTYSPLEIAKLESDFKYMPWFHDLLTIVDTYFLSGGNKNYA